MVRLNWNAVLGLIYKPDVRCVSNWTYAIRGSYFILKIIMSLLMYRPLLFGILGLSTQDKRHSIHPSLFLRQCATMLLIEHIGISMGAMGF